jgi:N-methylhydantoinase A
MGGTQPTVTDANLVLGRLSSEHFLGGRMRLSPEAAIEALRSLGEKAELRTLHDLQRHQLAALGIIQVVNAHMARALRVISVERGYDPRDFILVSFGGAGGLHACDLARGLGIRKVLIPRGASTLSAFGMLSADVIKDYVQTVMLPGDFPYHDLEMRVTELVARGKREISDEGIPLESVSVFREVDMRYVGQSYELTVPLSPQAVEAFHRAHLAAYGHRETQAPVEIVNIRVRVEGDIPHPQLQHLSFIDPGAQDALTGYRSVILHDGPQQVPFYQGARLQTGDEIHGPAIIMLEDTTVFLESDDHAIVDQYMNYIIDVR